MIKFDTSEADMFFFKKREPFALKRIVGITVAGMQEVKNKIQLFFRLNEDEQIYCVFLLKKDNYSTKDGSYSFNKKNIIGKKFLVSFNRNNSGFLLIETAKPFNGEKVIW